MEGPPTVDDPLAAAARAAAAGDPDAMRGLLEALAPTTLRVVRAIAGRGSSDIEDIGQETLIALVRALPAFRGDCTVRRYASRIAVRTALAARRRGRSDQERLDAMTLAAEEPEAPASPGEQAVASRRKRLLRGLFDRLPEVQAETLALRVVLGCSMEEVATATGAPVNTVRSRLRLAKEALRRRIEEDPSLAELLDESLTRATS